MPTKPSLARAARLTAVTLALIAPLPSLGCAPALRTDDYYFTGQNGAAQPVPIAVCRAWGLSCPS